MGHVGFAGAFVQREVLSILAQRFFPFPIYFHFSLAVFCSLPFTLLFTLCTQCITQNTKHTYYQHTQHNQQQQQQNGNCLLLVASVVERKKKNEYNGVKKGISWHFIVSQKLAQRKQKTSDGQRALGVGRRVMGNGWWVVGGGRHYMTRRQAPWGGEEAS